MARGAAARSGRTPRRNAPCLPPYRRGAVHRGLGEGRIRHGDIGFGHQHACPHGRSRAAGEVRRRAARPVDAGGVHPVDRPRGPPRHRRRRSRGGAVDSGRRPRRGGRSRIDQNVPAAQLVRTVLQHDDQPGEPDGPDAGAQTAGAVFRAVSGGPLGGRAGARHRTWRADARRDSRRTRRGLARQPRSSSTRGMRAAISQREKAQSRASRLQRRRAVNDALSSLRRGDIVNIANGRRVGLGGRPRARPRRGRPSAAGADRKPLGGTHFVGRLLGCIGEGGLDDAAEAGRAPPAARAPRCGVGAAVGDGGDGDPQGQAKRPTASTTTSTPNWRAFASSCSATPRHRIADREEKARLAERYLRIERDNEQIQQKVAAATNSLARTFDRIVVLLTERGFIRDDDGDPTVTDDGRLLARIYSESDLLVAECLRAGVWEGLSPAELAGVLSAVLYEARGDSSDPAGRRGPDRQAATCAGRHPPVRRRAAHRRAAAPDLAEPRARRGFRRRRLPMGYHRRPGLRARRVRHRPHRLAACRRATSSAGAARSSIWPTRCAMPRRRRSSAPPRNAQSPTFDAASSLLMQGRVSAGSAITRTIRERR